jgi:hypothetical protein
MRPTRDVDLPIAVDSLAPDQRIDGQAAASSERERTGAIGAASTTAGLALILVAVLAAFGEFAVVEHLVVDGNAARTAANIARSETLFRLGITSLLVVACLDVVVAWGLYRVFKPVDTGLSMLAAWLRVAYAAIFAVAIAQLIGVLHLLPGTSGETAQIMMQVQAYKDIWNAALVLFAVHLILLGILAWKATYTPSWLGALLVVAGIGYVIDAFGTVLLADYRANVAAFTFVGELILIGWLLVRGRRLTVIA